MLDILKIGKPLILMFLSQFQYRNENQNFISNVIFQFIKKNKMALWVHGLRSIENESINCQSRYETLYL